jgi:hypothetical protein
MAKRGRPRKQGERYPSGGLRRPTLEQLKEAERRQRLGEIAYVMAQPHRVWAGKQAGNPWLENALGRFIIGRKLREELYHAGDHYALTFARWAAAKGIPHPKRRHMVGGGVGPSDATVAAWWREIEGMEGALRRYGRAYINIRHLCLDDEDLPDEAAADTLAGLRALAVHLGRLPERAHPFVSAVDNRRAA